MNNMGNISNEIVKLNVIAIEDFMIPNRTKQQNSSSSNNDDDDFSNCNSIKVIFNVNSEAILKISIVL